MSARVRPDYIALEQAARRERSRAVYRLVIQPVVNLFRGRTGTRGRRLVTA